MIGLEVRIEREGRKEEEEATMGEARKGANCSRFERLTPQVDGR